VVCGCVREIVGRYENWRVTTCVPTRVVSSFLVGCCMVHMDECSGSLMRMMQMME